MNQKINLKNLKKLERIAKHNLKNVQIVQDFSGLQRFGIKYEKIRGISVVGIVNPTSNEVELLNDCAYQDLLTLTEKFEKETGVEWRYNVINVADTLKEKGYLR